MCDTRPRGNKRPETFDSLNLPSEVAVFDDGFNAGHRLFIRLFRRDSDLCSGFQIGGFAIFLIAGDFCVTGDRMGMLFAVVTSHD